MLHYDSDEVKKLKNDIVESIINIEDLKKEFASMRGESYTSPFDIEEFVKYKTRDDFDCVFDMLNTLDIDFYDERWKKEDWVAVIIAGIVGSIADFIITKTDLLKPLDNELKNILSSKDTKSLQETLDSFSNKFRNGNSAPIDFQDFDMPGLKSIHEQFSYGHDPLRFIEGICQMITGMYSGVDIAGNAIKTTFGEGIDNPIFAVVSYVAHMVSDLCNKQGIPYPGSTFVMQFGSQEARDTLAAAYRGQLFNFRTFLYQSIPSLLVSIIIHAWAIYDNYSKTGKINIRIGSNLKYQPMLLVANTMIVTENAISTALMYGGYKNPHNLLRLNWPAMANTIRHTIKYLRNEHARIKQNGKEIESLLKEYEQKDYTIKSHEVIQAELDEEFEEFCKKMEV